MSGPTRDPRIEIRRMPLRESGRWSGPTRDPRIEILYYGTDIQVNGVGSHTGPAD